MMKSAPSIATPNVLHFSTFQGVALYTRVFLISDSRLSQREVLINALKVLYGRFLAEPQ
jgi:hypothetical protein